VTDRLLGPGDVVVLHDAAGRRYRLTLAPGATRSTHAGELTHDSLIGQPEGTVVETSLGRPVLALRPALTERAAGGRRRAGQLGAKDLGAVLLHADVSPGDLVVMAGAGGGLLPAVLRAVGPGGRVVAYEPRQDVLTELRAAAEEAAGRPPPNLELRAADPTGGIAERAADRALLDLPEPWAAVPAVAAALRPGGSVFALCPNAGQVQRFCDALREAGGFGLIETVEVLERGWTVRDRSLRPVHRMVAHTAFLTFARRLAGEEVFETDTD